MQNIDVEDYTFGRRSSRQVDTNQRFIDEYRKTRTLQDANIVIASFTNKNTKDINELKNKSGIITLDITGDSGRFSDDDIKKIINNKNSVVLNNDNGVYYLYEIENNYLVFSNIQTPLIDEVDYYSIYVNISPEAVNFGTWSKEQITPVGGASVWGEITGDLENQTDLKNALDDKANVEDIPTKTSDLTNDSGFITEVNWGDIGGTLSNQTDLKNNFDNIDFMLNAHSGSINRLDTEKQNLLVDDPNLQAQNIKTVGGTRILGSGNIPVPSINNSYSSSQDDTYSCDYVNNNVGGDIEEQGTNYIKYKSGLKMCWGSESTHNLNGYFRESNPTFPIEFTTPPIVVSTLQLSPSGSVWESRIDIFLCGINTTNFTVRLGNPNAEIGDKNLIIKYIAIGI